MDEPGLRETTGVSVEQVGRPSLSFDPFVPWVAVILLAAAVCAVARWSYARTTRPVSPMRLAALYLLRILAALVVLLCLAHPVWVQEKALREKGLCFIVLDNSASMNIRDAPQGRTRWEFAGRFFAEHQDELAKLGKRYDIRRFLFDAVPQETASLPGEDAKTAARKPEGRATDLAALLDRLAGETGGTPCAGVLLLTDGRHNTPKDPIAAARQFQAARAPLYLVGLGQESAPKDYADIQIKLLEVPERAFVHGQMTIRVEVESQLPKAEQVPLVVLVNGEEIKRQPLSLPAGREVQSHEVAYRPSQLGVHRVVATIPALPHEANVNNNSRTAYFRVYKSKLGVWYIEGAVRKEFGVLRAALETAPNIGLMARNVFVRRGREEVHFLPPNEDGWRELRMVIIGDLPARQFKPEDLQRLVRFVEEGGGLLLLGGLETLGPGGWAQTPLAPVLPVELNLKDGGVDGPLPIAPTPEGATHPGVRLTSDPEHARDIWKVLPPLPGVNKVGKVKPAARVLLTAGKEPLLIVQEFGKGRCGVFTGDATWQWILKAGQADAHRSFWRNLVTWLSHSEYRDSQQVVFVDTDRLLYMLGDEVALNATVQSTEAVKGRIENAVVKASLEQENGPKKTWELGRGPGEYGARQTPQTPGTYLFRAEVFDQAGQSLGKDEIHLQVEVTDVENNNPRAHPALLRQLAAVSGGVLYDSEHAGDAFQHLMNRPPGFAKTVREPTELWNHWSLFAVFLALITLEWALRKRWGLI